MKKQAITAALIAAYLVAAVFTFTYKYQRIEAKEMALLTQEEQRAYPASLAAIAWPIYWTGHFAWMWTSPNARKQGGAE